VLTKESKIAVVGAGTIRGVTAACIHRSGWNTEIICKHQEIVDKIAAQGLRVSGVKGELTAKVKAVKNISDLSEPKDLFLLATKANDCVSAARQLTAFLKPDSTVVCLQNRNQFSKRVYLRTRKRARCGNTHKRCGTEYGS